MYLVPFLSKQVSDPWSSYDEQNFREHGSYQDSVLYVPSIHAKLRLLEKNIYLCSIKTNDGIYKNFYIYPETRSSFYFSAYIPQIGLVHKLKEANISHHELPENSLFRDLLSSYNDFCSEDGYEICDDISIIDDSLLIKVNSPFSDLLDKYDLGLFNPNIIDQYKELNICYLSILKEYHLLINDDYIKKEFALHRIGKTLIGIGKRLLLFGLFGIAIDEFLDWGDMGNDLTYFNDNNITNNDSYSDSIVDFSNGQNYISFGHAPNDGSYMKTNQDVHVQVAGGNDKGSFDVYLHNGNKYIDFKDQWVKIQGKTRFHLLGNDYIIKG